MEKEKELGMWKIEGESCAEIAQMVDESAETAKFLHKAVDDARARLNEHMQKSNEKIWERIHAELKLKEDHGMRLHVDTETAKTGVIIVREREREAGLGDFLSHIFRI